MENLEKATRNSNGEKNHKICKKYSNINNFHQTKKSAISPSGWLKEKNIYEKALL